MVLTKINLMFLKKVILRFFIISTIYIVFHIVILINRKKKQNMLVFYGRKFSIQLPLRFILKKNILL